MDTLVASITHKTLEKLILTETILTPAATKALGRSLPEMSSLQVLELTGVDRSILQAEDMEALFGGLKKMLPLFSLTLKNFSLRACLAPLFRSFRLFPNLENLFLVNLGLDEDDLRGLLKSFQFIPKLETLDLAGTHLGHAVRSIVPHVTNLLELKWLFIKETSHSEEDLKYVQDTVQQALPEVAVF